MTRNPTPVLLLLVSVASVLGAQVTSPAGSAGSVQGASALVGVESPIISENYVLMPGDKLLITVTGPVTYSYESWVTYEGKVTINMPLTQYQAVAVSDEAQLPNVVDAIRVSNLTLEQAQDTITYEMRRYFRDVQVKLTLLVLRSGIVFVAGEVQYPGAYNASPVERVSQVVARAGGLAPLGSRTNINVIRGGRLFAIADIARFESHGDLRANPFVESGDVIFVPAVDGLVTVKGAVFGRDEYRLRTSALTTEKERISEGIYELEPGERVSDLIRKAGGITPWADPANSYVERIVLGGEGARAKLRVDLHAVLFEHDSTRNIVLMNSDILVVPPINTLVYVEGEVQSPGPFSFTPNQRASHYVGQAGGPTHYANMRAAYIQRGRGEYGRMPLKADPVVEPGDIIVVPRVALRWWQDYVQIISAIGIPIATILVTVSLSRSK